MIVFTFYNSFMTKQFLPPLRFELRTCKHTSRARPRDLWNVLFTFSSNGQNCPILMAWGVYCL